MISQAASRKTCRQVSHNVYGERQNIGDRYRNVIGIFMNQIMRGEPMTIFGDGAQTRAFSYVGDVAPQIAASIELPNARCEIFNLGVDEPTSLIELAHEVARAMGVKPNIKHLEARKEVVNAVADHSKASKIFGHKQTTGLKDGLARMAEWSRRTGPRLPTIFKNIEVRKNLPPSWRV
jgi:UDP-glucose 4-epimerase